MYTTPCYILIEMLFYLQHKWGWTCILIRQRQHRTLLETMATSFTISLVNIWIWISTHGFIYNIYTLLIFGFLAFVTLSVYEKYYVYS